MFYWSGKKMVKKRYIKFEYFLDFIIKNGFCAYFINTKTLHKPRIVYSADVNAYRLVKLLNWK